MLTGLIVDYGGVLTDPPMVAVVRRAREHGLRTALLSNADGGFDAGWDELFDTVVLSGQVGMAKPDKRIYRLTAARLGLATSDCVFVDDLVVNVRGAVRAGMVGVHHQAVATTIEELEALFEVPF